MLVYFLFLFQLFLFYICFRFWLDIKDNIKDLSITAKKTAIIDFLTQHKYTYVELTDEEIDQVYNAYFHHIFEDNVSSNVYLYYGSYRKIKGDMYQMAKYYQKAIELNNIYATSHLANYYLKINDKINAAKYYSLLVKNGKYTYMKEMHEYCRDTKYYENMLKYIAQMAESNDKFAIISLANHYYNIKDYVKMKEYYLLTLVSKESLDNHILKYIKEQKDIDFLHQIFQIKSLLFNDDKLLQLIEELFVDNPSSKLIEIISYIDIKYFVHPTVSHPLILCKKLLTEKIDLLDLHFNYSPNGQGYNEAKRDFTNRLI